MSSQRRKTADGYRIIHASKVFLRLKMFWKTVEIQAVECQKDETLNNCSNVKLKSVRKYLCIKISYIVRIVKLDDRQSESHKTRINENNMARLMSLGHCCLHVYWFEHWTFSMCICGVRCVFVYFSFDRLCCLCCLWMETRLFLVFNFLPFSQTLISFFFLI